VWLVGLNFNAAAAAAAAISSNEVGVKRYK
jgi:hypothetical protein